MLATSIISVLFNRGIRFIKLLASKDLPHPGGPHKRIECPPAAAIFSAFCAVCCSIIFVLLA